MRRLVPIQIRLILAITFLTAFAPCAEAQFGRIRRFLPRKTKTPVEQLAEGIDEVEEDLNETGTVVAKRPDIWGESRLTKHRQEVERVLVKEIDKFELLLNASIARSDQAFLASATSISAAMGNLALSNIDTDGNITYVNRNDKTQMVTVPGATALGTSIVGTTPTTVIDAEGNPKQVEGGIIGTEPFGLFDKSPFNPGDGELGFKDKTINLEPTIRLDQLNRYLQHLQELRRLNEGGDTADAPGYALNLVRIPVSVIPGDKTRKGHGASITITAKSHYTASLLPTTFRTLVINDLIDQLSVPLVKVAHVIDFEQEELRKNVTRFGSAAANLKSIADSIAKCDPTDAECRQAYLEPLKNANTHLRTASCGVVDRLTIDETRTLNIALASADDVVVLLETIENAGSFQRLFADAEDMPQTFPPMMSRMKSLQAELTERKFDSISRELGVLTKSARNIASQENTDAKMADVNKYKSSFREFRINVYKQIDGKVATSKDNSDRIQQVAQKIVNSTDAITQSTERLQAAFDAGTIASVPSASPRARTARYAVAPSRMLCVFGEDQFKIVAERLAGFLINGCEGETIHLSDARGFLREELNGAYDYLTSSAGLHHWDNTSAILAAIRGGQDLSPFREVMMVKCDKNCTEVQQSLAWAILVEAVLLNDRLNRDLKRVAQDPECPCSFGDWYEFHRPEPGPEARRAFIDYVECRWPIHVFAVDPVTQDQNVADAYSMRREMQLAMALSFVSGQMSAQNMTRYMRRLELDMQTVALNRTVVSFGHGRDTFGWRFYPRVQTPDFESNTTVIWRDLIMGGPKKDHLLKDHRLEPGMRELTALVIMPSFINHMRFDVRSNFFELTDPDDTAASMKKTIQMSRKIRGMEQLAMVCDGEAEMYRHGEVERLLARVKQLSRKMPLQTLYTQVPNENTLGGFEMFSSGVTDLSPELIDYYGHPGIQPGGETKMFLVGKNFSVHETRVIAGNRDCKFDLISREVMEVTIPPNVRVVTCYKRKTAKGKEAKCTTDCGAIERYVDVHLATPYGVTRHLQLPVIDSTTTEIEGFSWEPENLAATYLFKVDDADKDFAVGNVKSIRLSDPKELKFRVPATLQPKNELSVKISVHITTDTIVAASSTLPTVLKYGDSELFSATYDPAAGAYVLRGSMLYEMHRQIGAKVSDALGTRYGKKYDDIDGSDVEVHIHVVPEGATFNLVRKHPVLQIKMLKMP